MKYVVWFVLLCVLVGCQGQGGPMRHTDVSLVPAGPVKLERVTESMGYSDCVYTFEHEGHRYLALYQGTLLHSESCPCWEKAFKGASLTPAKIRPEKTMEEILPASGPEYDD